MNLPKHWRTFLVLFLLIIGGAASAAGCETNIPTATDNRINIESFVPDPGCWVVDVKDKLDTYRVASFAENLAKGLLFAFGAVGVILAQSTGSWNAWLIRLGYSAVAFAMINGYASGNGVGSTLTTTMMSGWKQGYVQSARAGNSDLNDTITQTSSELSISIGNYMLSTAALRSYESVAEGLGPLTDPEAIDRVLENFADERKKAQESAAEINPFKGITANITSVLLIGFHAVFASIIFSSGLIMVLLDQLFPLIVAVAAIGMPSAAWGAFALALGNILTVIVTPLMMGILTGTALRAPLESMNQSMRVNAANAQDHLSNIQSKWDGCLAGLDPNFLERTKNCMSAVFTTTANATPLDDMVSYNNDVMIGLGLAAVAGIIAFATMMLQLRRIPALIMQVVGTAGGGESSGVGSNPVTAAAGKAASIAGKAAMAKVTGGGSAAAGAAAKAAGGGGGVRSIGSRHQSAGGSAGKVNNASTSSTARNYSGGGGAGVSNASVGSRGGNYGSSGAAGMSNSGASAQPSSTGSNNASTGKVSSNASTARSSSYSSGGSVGSSNASSTSASYGSRGAEPTNNRRALNSGNAHTTRKPAKIRKGANNS